VDAVQKIRTQTGDNYCGDNRLDISTLVRAEMRRAVSYKTVLQ